MKLSKSKKREAAKALGYRSGFEMEFHSFFPYMEYEPEAFPYQVEETRKYTPDFVFDDVWYECKGRFTAADRKKMLLLQRQYPFQEIVLVFQNPHIRLTKAKKSKTYAEWAEAHGFRWTTIEELRDEKG